MKKLLSLALALAVCLGLAACGHTHVWKDADCTAPKTCTECGETEGELGAHVWVDATCEAARHCEVCGETEGQPLEHSWMEATVEAPKTCSLCGLTEGEPLPDTYFARNNLKFEELHDFELPFACAFTDAAYENVVEPDGMWLELSMVSYTFGEITSKPSEQEGYIEVTIPYKATFSLQDYVDTAKHNASDPWLISYSALSVGDSYTGLIVPERTLIGSGTLESKKDFEWEGNSYSISIKDDVDDYSSVSGWMLYSGEVYRNIWYYENTLVLTVTIPEGYDGAVLYIERDGKTEVEPYEIDEEIEDKDEHFLDEHDADYYIYYRLSDLIQ